MDITHEFAKLFTTDNLLFTVLALLGMLGHAIKKYLAKELNGSVLDYVLLNNPKRTILAVLTTIGTCFALILGEQLPTQVGAFIMLAFTTGYTADSSVNKEE